MEANFFRQATALDIKGDLQFTLQRGKDDNWIVSVLLNNRHCGDDAQRLIPPLILKGTAAELDNGFFEAIAAPIQETSALCRNMEGYLKAREEAQKQSAMEKDKADKEKKEKEARGKKYKDALQKSEELEKEGKHREAWTKMPDPADYPEHEEAIRKRKAELARHFAPDLFNGGAKQEQTNIL